MSSSKYTVDFTDNKIDASQFIGGYNSWELKPQGPPVRPGNKSDAGPFYLNNITGIKCYGATSTDTFETDGLAANVSFTKGTLITMTGPSGDNVINLSSADGTQANFQLKAA